MNERCVRDRVLLRRRWFGCGCRDGPSRSNGAFTIDLESLPLLRLSDCLPACLPVSGKGPIVHIFVILISVHSFVHVKDRQTPERLSLGNGHRENSVIVFQILVPAVPLDGLLRHPHLHSACGRSPMLAAICCENIYSLGWDSQLYLSSSLSLANIWWESTFTFARYDVSTARYIYICMHRNSQSEAVLCFGSLRVLRIGFCCS